MRYFLTFLTAFSFFLSGCKDDYLTAEEQLKVDLDLIAKYLAEKNLTAQSTASGLHYIIEKPGTDGNPNINSTVTVHYKGHFLDGKVFDQTTGTPISFPLNAVIKGWQEGIPLFQKGGKGVLIIPSELGYGTRPPSGIPANAVLVFDVELVKFN
jgi:FKBP-type peptidyl-prolyl cis-trans isomerase FkpA